MSKLSPEMQEARNAKFRATIAAKKAAGWKPQVKQKEQSVPLDAIPTKKKRRRRTRVSATKGGAWVMIRLRSGRETRLTLAEAAEMHDYLNEVFNGS